MIRVALRNPSARVAVRASKFVSHAQAENVMAWRDVLAERRAPVAARRPGSVARTETPPASGSPSRIMAPSRKICARTSMAELFLRVGGQIEQRVLISDLAPGLEDCAPPRFHRGSSVSSTCQRAVRSSPCSTMEDITRLPLLQLVASRNWRADPIRPLTSSRVKARNW